MPAYLIGLLEPLELEEYFNDNWGLYVEFPNSIEKNMYDMYLIVLSHELDIVKSDIEFELNVKSLIIHALWYLITLFHAKTLIDEEEILAYCNYNINLTIYLKNIPESLRELCNKHVKLLCKSVKSQGLVLIAFETNDLLE